MSSRVGIRIISRILKAPFEWNPSANAYYDLIGKIWLVKQGGYYDRGHGTGGIYVDAEPGLRGGYFDRA